MKVLPKTGLLMLALLLHYCIFSQIALSFTGTPTITGTAGAVGAKYIYPNIGTTGAITIKSVIEILNITGGAVLFEIDGTSTGSNNAFQPSIYGSQTSGNCWAIQFQISFYNAANDAPLILSSFRSSGIDIDGTATLREFNTFYYPNNYTLDNPTSLTVTSNSGVYQFLSPGTGYTGISLTQTNVAVTCLYNNRSSITLSIGSCCLGGACSATSGSSRLHSINFFDALAFGSPMITLPVRLTEFTARKTNGGVALRWTSAEETSLSHFIVQRSDDGRRFTDIARISSKGNSSSYDYTDSTLWQGIAVWYRLKPTDIDGHFTYSPTIQIKNQANGIQTLSVSPNPVINNFTITVQSGKSQKIDFRLVDKEGRLIKSFSRTIVQGVNVFPVETDAKLAKGIYFLQAIAADGNISAIKIAVQ